MDDSTMQPDARRPYPGDIMIHGLMGALAREQGRVRRLSWGLGIICASLLGIVVFQLIIPAFPDIPPFMLGTLAGVSVWVLVLLLRL